VLAVISMFVSVWLGLEALLWVTDPMGAWGYAVTLRWVRGHSYEHPTGYEHPPGQWQVDGKRITITDGDARWTPGTGPRACDLVVVGDSIAWGFGVSDDETFASYLARDLPDVEVHNVARTGYNIENIRESIDYYDTDAYLYFVTNNDDGARRGMMPPLVRVTPVAAYAALAYQRLNARYGEDKIHSRFGVVIRELTQHENLLIVVQENDRLAHIVPDALVISDYTETVSAVDSHPSGEGHRQIAETILPAVRAHMRRWC